MSEIDEMMSQILTGTQDSKKVPSSNSVLIEIVRRIVKGWFGAILLFVITLICAYVLNNYLSPFHKYSTKMEVMIVKEKDGNRDGSINAEVMSEITGWRTTYNKLDEIRIMRSRSVIDRMIRNNHFLDSAYVNKQR